MGIRKKMQSLKAETDGLYAINAPSEIWGKRFKHMR